MWEVLLNKQKESEAMSAGKYSYKNAAIRICVDVLQEGRIEGSIHTPYCVEKIQFRDVMTLFMELDHIADERSFPNAMFERRSFFRKRKNEKQEFVDEVRKLSNIDAEYGKVETIQIFLTSRRFASVQGRMFFMGTNKLKNFTSELEMIKLIEENSVSEQIEYQEREVR